MFDVRIIAALPLAVRKGSAFPLAANFRFGEAAPRHLGGVASQKIREARDGKPQAFRTAGGTAACVELTFNQGPL
ncbi:MAG: hypothetical protein WCB68_04645 [Pyrinomonadaceae bacterium]